MGLRDVMDLNDKKNRVLKAFRDENGECFVVEELKPLMAKGCDDPQLVFAYAESLRILGRLQESRSVFERLLRLGAGKKTSVVQAKLATVLSDIGERVEAEHWFAESMNCDPTNKLGWLWLLRANNLARSGDYLQAEECLRTAVSLTDTVDEDEAHLNLGMVLRCQQKYSEALECLREALKFRPNCETISNAICSIERMGQ